MFSYFFSSTENANQGVKGNVPSGTLVDHIVDDYKLEEGGSFSFLLTAQGGLKGTSKPMYYRCILNENERPPIRFANDASVAATGIDKSSLHELVYGLSFQCKFFETSYERHRKIVDTNYAFL